MPNLKSAAKAMRSSARKRVINTKVKEKVRKEIKELKALIANNKKSEAEAKLSAVMSALHKAVKKKVLNKNAVSRKISRLAQQIKKIS